MIRMEDWLLSKQMLDEKLKEIEDIWKENDIKHVKYATVTPRPNGQVERLRIGIKIYVWCNGMLIAYHIIPRIEHHKSCCSTSISETLCKIN